MPYVSEAIIDFRARSLSSVEYEIVLSENTAIFDCYYYLSHFTECQLEGWYMSRTLQLNLIPLTEPVYYLTGYILPYFSDNTPKNKVKSADDIWYDTVIQKVDILSLSRFFIWYLF